MTAVSGAPLAGMRIIEVSSFVAAPLGGMTLSQLGADVIRIDPPAGGLDYRRWPVTEANVSLFWHGLNKGKRSVVIDILQHEGRELAMALATAPGDDAGMLLTNFPARGWLSFEALKARRPDILQVTVQGDRHGGSAVDYTINSRVGIPFITGIGADSDVINHVLPAWDLVTGHLAAIGLLAAERKRLRLGAGGEVKLALEDVALAMVSHLGFTAEAQLGGVRRRHGNDLFGAFGRDFMCATGDRVMVVALTLKQWRSLCAAASIGGAAAALGARLNLNLDTEGDRFRARDEIAALLQPWFAVRSFEAVRTELDRHAVCWGRYQTLHDLVRFDPACSEANPLFTTVAQSGVGSVLAAGTPLDFVGFGRMSARPAPRLGQHTEEVMTDVLGLSGGQYGALVDRGVVAAPP